MKPPRLDLWLAMVGAVLLALALVGCGTPATIARKVVAGIDVLDGAAARMGRAWIKSCGGEARKLRDSGRLAEADVKYLACEQTADKLVQGVVLVEDAAQVASDAIDAGEALKAKHYAAVIGPVIDLARALVKIFADAGLQLPAIGGL